jgi:hypothetical protein
MVAHENIAAADYGTRTSVTLLDALIDSMVLVRPGSDAERFASDLKRLGDGAARAAYELDMLLEDHAAPAELPLSDRRQRVA